MKKDHQITYEKKIDGSSTHYYWDCSYFTRVRVKDYRCNFKCMVHIGNHEILCILNFYACW